MPTGVSLHERDGKYYIRCRIRQKLYKFKPEEVVRQKVINWLLDDLRYARAQVAVEVPVTIGSTVHDKSADIIVYTDTSRVQQWIIVEVKKPKRKDGVDQLKSYMNATGATFGYWSNGTDERFLLCTKTNDYSSPIWRLPAVNETLADIDEPHTRAKLKPVTDR